MFKSLYVNNVHWVTCPNRDIPAPGSTKVRSIRYQRERFFSTHRVGVLKAGAGGRVKAVPLGESRLPRAAEAAGPPGGGGQRIGEFIFDG